MCESPWAKIQNWADSFLSHIITTNETCVHHSTSTKQGVNEKGRAWTSKPSHGSHLATSWQLFFSTDAICTLNFWHECRTINVEYDCKVVSEVRLSDRCKRRDLSVRDVFLSETTLVPIQQPWLNKNWYNSAGKHVRILLIAQTYNPTNFMTLVG